MTPREAFQLAMQHHQAGRIKEAEELYQSILTQQPGLPTVLSNLGMIHLSRGELDSAIDCFQRALATAPNLPLTLSNLGVALLQAGHAEEAVISCKKALELAPNFTPARHNLGNALCKLNRLEEGIAELKKTLELQPNDAQVLCSLGAASRMAADLPGAVGWYRKAIDCQPNFATAHNDLGACLHLMNENREAEAAYRQALALQPDYLSARFNLGRLLVQTGQYDQAITSFQKALELDPRNEAAYWNLTEIAARKNDRLESSGPPRLPYLGDKFVLLRCGPEAWQQLRQAGLHGGHAVDPTTGVDLWLAAQVQLTAAEDRTEALARWLQWTRNHAAMAGATCAVWSPQIPESIAKFFRRRAGNDLIEIHSDDVAQIRRQLSAHAVAPPQTDDKIFAVVSVRNGGAELLPHWLDHYTRLGVDKLLVGVFDDVAAALQSELERCARQWPFERFVQTWHGNSEQEHYSQRQSGCRAAGARPLTWIMHTDLDEFHQYPVPLREIISTAARNEIDVIHGNFVDRVAAGGALPAVRTHPSIWEQFPYQCRLTEHILLGMTRKVMLSRFHVHVGSGHHDAIGYSVATPPIGKPEDYLVAHFKWHGDVVNRLRWGLQFDHPHERWKQEARRFLAWIDAHGGRIDLSDPRLEAKVVTA